MSTDTPLNAEVEQPPVPGEPKNSPGKGRDSGTIGCGCMAGAMTLFALLVGGCGLNWSRGAKQDLGEVTLEQANDREQTPAGSFVKFRGQIDPESVAEITGRGDNAGSIMFTLEDAPHLVVFCRKRDPLAIALRDGGEVEFEETVAFETQFAGRIYNGNDSLSDAPSFQVYRYITDNLGLANADHARVLVSGDTARSWLIKSYWAYGFAIILGLVALFGWVFTIRDWLSGPSESAAAEPQ